MCTCTNNFPSFVQMGAGGVSARAVAFAAQRRAERGPRGQEDVCTWLWRVFGAAAAWSGERESGVVLGTLTTVSHLCLCTIERADVCCFFTRTAASHWGQAETTLALFLVEEKQLRRCTLNSKLPWCTKSHPASIPPPTTTHNHTHKFTLKVYYISFHRQEKNGGGFILQLCLSALGLGDGRRVAGNTGPDVGALLGDGAVDR